MMQHKGNKSEETIRVEQLFMAIMHTLNMAVCYEWKCGNGTIDFVVGTDAGKGKIYWEGMTGVELKTTMNDLRTGNGLNVRAFPFNYLLVPEKIAYSAVKYMERYSGYFGHVGLLVLMDDYTLDIHRPATVILPDERNHGYHTNTVNLSEFEKYYDSVAFALGQFGDNPVTVHNFKTNETKMVEIWIDPEVREIDDDGKVKVSA